MVSVTNLSWPLPLPWQPLGAKEPVFVLPGTPPPVLAVVVVGTGITLATQSWRLLAWLCLIVPQDISSFCTEGQRAEGRGQGMESEPPNNSRVQGTATGKKDPRAGVLMQDMNGATSL